MKWHDGDTTLGFTRKGKRTAIKSLLCIEKFDDLVHTFYDTNADKDLRVENDCNLIAAIYS